MDAAIETLTAIATRLASSPQISPAGLSKPINIKTSAEMARSLQAVRISGQRPAQSLVPMRRRLRLVSPAILVIGALILLFPPRSMAQDVALGRKIVTKGGAGSAVACSSCHGANSEGNAAAGFPRLAGMSTAYVEEQLNNFAEGKRQNPIMSPIAKQLSPAERKAVGVYFATLPRPTAVVAGNDNQLKSSDIGAWLALRGRWEVDVPACVQCHGHGGTGVGAAFPAIAGQPTAYLAAQLHAFKDGGRPGGPMNLMTVVAKKLSDEDITAVAQHFGASGVAVASGAPEKEKK